MTRTFTGSSRGCKLTRKVARCSEPNTTKTANPRKKKQTIKKKEREKKEVKKWSRFP